MKKLYDGKFQIYDVNGLNVYVLSSKGMDTVDIYVNYPTYRHMMFIYVVSCDENDIDFLIHSIESDFENIIKNYFIEVDQLEDM